MTRNAIPIRPLRRALMEGSRITKALLAVVCLLGFGCDERGPDGSLPTLLRIGVLPDEQREKLVERYEPLRDHLSQSLGVPCDLVFAEDYLGLVTAFGVGDVDLAFFRGISFVQARNAYGAVPPVMRDIDTRFTSYFVARADTPGSRIENFEGETFAFGSRLSTSGHLMPRHFLALQDIKPETFFREIRYSGAHDTTVEWLRDGVVNVGVVSAQILKAMLADGRVEKSEFRILKESPPYCNYVWAMQPSLGRDARLKLRKAFLELSPANDRHYRILQNLDAGGFVPADDAMFADLERIALNVGLLE